MPTPAGYIPQLDSVRGWAILLVMAFHVFGIVTALDGAGPDSPLWLRWVAAGNTGVTLFFVLSGFLLSLPFITGLRQHRDVSIKRFFRARALRILPLYYTMVLVAWLVTRQSAAALKALMFIPVGYDLGPFGVPWWSLSTEVQFYLLLPWAMLLLQWRAGRYLLVAVLGGWFALQWHFFHTPAWLSNVSNPWQQSLFGRVFAFVIGCGCGWLYSAAGYARFARASAWVWASFIVTLVLLATLLQWYAVMGQRAALVAQPMYHNYEALLWGGVILCIVSLRGATTLLFINPLFAHIGRISYSLFLVHLPVQFYLLVPLRAPPSNQVDLSKASNVATVALTVLLAWLAALVTYHAIEKPFLRLKTAKR